MNPAGAVLLARGETQGSTQRIKTILDFLPNLNALTTDPEMELAIQRVAINLSLVAETSTTTRKLLTWQNSGAFDTKFKANFL